MPRRALTPAASAQPVAFTPKDEKKLKSAIGRFGRQWSTIHAEKHFSTYPLTIIKAKGLAIIKSSKESKDRCEACAVSRMAAAPPRRQRMAAEVASARVTGGPRGPGWSPRRS